MYQVQLEFIPGNSQIWVARLNPQDPVYEYDNEAEAESKAQQLQGEDTTGRKYRVFSL